MEMLDPYIYSNEDNDDLVGDGDLFAPTAIHGDDINDSTFSTPAEATLAKRFIAEIREKLDVIERMMSKTNRLGAEDVERLLLNTPKSRVPQGKVIEGVFDGEHMMGADGKQYTVPANYASKSKLVEGDILKLTITDDGSFLYKQIGPIERQRVVCKLTCDEVTGDYVAIADGKKWNVLLASVTFFHAEPGDDLVVLLPKNAPSRWAAVENVMKKIGSEVEAKSGVTKKKA